MKAAYVHQWNQLGEKTPQAIVDTMHGHFDEIRFKTHQWLTFTGRFDAGGAFDLTDLNAVKECINYFAAKGIRPLPWCVPMGLDVGNEARLAAQIALAADRIDLDVEPYAEFWPGIAQGNYSAVQPYFSLLRQLVGDSVEITLDFPARNSAWEWGRMHHVVSLASPYVDRMALQSYFGLAQARDSEERVRGLGWKGPIEHIIIPSQFGEFLPYLDQHHYDGFAVWRAADMTANAYAFMDQFTFDGGVTPHPTISWQEPGFAALAKKLGKGTVGNAAELAESNNWGDVRQKSDNGGFMYWINEVNQNVWVGVDGPVSEQRIEFR